MDKERRNEIAFLLLKNRLSNKGFNLDKNFVKRELGNLAKATGVEHDEIKEFLRGLISELVKEALR